MFGYDFDIIHRKGKKKLLQMHSQERMRMWNHCFVYFYYPTRLDKWSKGWMEEGRRSMVIHSKDAEYSNSNNIARPWRGRKNHIGTWSIHWNKNSTATKSINFRVSYQVEELTHWIFHMGGKEFYTEASRTTQALRTTLFEGQGHVRSLYY